MLRNLAAVAIGIAVLLATLTIIMPLTNRQPDSIVVVVPSPTPQPPAYHVAP